MSIAINKNTIYIWGFAITLMSPFFIKSFELNVIISLIFLSFVGFGGNLKITKTVMIKLLILFSVVLISFFVHFFYSNSTYNVIKDLVYLTKPMIYLILGYFIALKVRDKDQIFRVVIFLGILLAFIHVFKVLAFLMEYKDFKINSIRYIGGKDNFLELLTCSLLVLNKKNEIFTINIRYKSVVYSVLALSFFMYFSRTMMVAFFIIVLTTKGYAKLTKRTFIVILSILMGIVISYRILNSIELERGAEGVEGFLYKIKIAPSEIFSSEVNMNNPAERWDHWRAYEASRAVRQIKDTPYHLGVIFGKGLGSLIDLGFEVKLGDEKMRYIPKIHNGYVYVFFKTGILGLALYVIFLISLYNQSYIKTNIKKVRIINNLISAIAIYYLFTSFIISGIFNPTDVITLFLGALLFLQFHYKKIK